MSLSNSRLLGAVVAALGAIVATLLLFGMEALATDPFRGPEPGLRVYRARKVLGRE